MVTQRSILKFEQRRTRDPPRLHIAQSPKDKADEPQDLLTCQFSLYVASFMTPLFERSNANVVESIEGHLARNFFRS